MIGFKKSKPSFIIQYSVGNARRTQAIIEREKPLDTCPCFNTDLELEKIAFKEIQYRY